jgi:sugar lactone lactonase YvrE
MLTLRTHSDTVVATIDRSERVRVPPTIETLTSGHGLLESLRVVPGAVLFSDWTAGDILRFEVASRQMTVVAHIASLPLCFDVEASGSLLALDGRVDELMRIGADGSTSTTANLAGLSKGAGNEVIVVGERTYLNFGNFDPSQGWPTEPVGLVAVVEQDGSARVVAEGLNFPNGMAVTPDGGSLIVAESYSGVLSAWTIAPDGDLTDRRVWADLNGDAPDGIGMAPDGTCWYASVPGEAVTRVAEGGEILDRIELGRAAFSCVVDPSSHSLFVVTANWSGGTGFRDPSHVWDGQLLHVSQ